MHGVFVQGKDVCLGCKRILNTTSDQPSNVHVQHRKGSYLPFTLNCPVTSAPWMFLKFYRHYNFIATIRCHGNQISFSKQPRNLTYTSLPNDALHELNKVGLEMYYFGIVDGRLLTADHCYTNT